MSEEAFRKRIAWLTVGFSVGLLIMGTLRYLTTQSGAEELLAGLVTPGYIALAVIFVVVLIRSGLPLSRLGFAPRLSIRHLLLAIGAIVLLRVSSFALAPLWEAVLSGPRNLERFADVEGSISSLVSLLVASWTIAAFGEELTFRIVLMRGISFALRDTRTAMVIALIVQAVLFGIVHAYQGPTGIVSSATSGLIFGAVTLAGRWSIWPAALAHGANNTIGILQLYNG